MQLLNKIVRDNIPDIIQKNGEKPVFEILSGPAFKEELNEKLYEEVGEFFDTVNKDNPDEKEEIEELVDIIEVIYALLDYRGISLEEFEKLRKAKANEKGIFKSKIMLIGVE